MKKLLAAVAIVALVIVAVRVFGGRGDREHRACERMQQLCDVGLTDDDVRECTSDLKTKAPRIMGSALDPFLDCAAGADSCGEVMGCFAGVGDEVLRDFGRGFERGFDRAHGKH